MTATDELRRLLDERGVEWKSGNFIQPDAETQWGNNRYSDYPELPPFLTISNCTPEQAIAATLGGQPAKLTAEAVRMYLKAMALDLQSPNPFKSLEEKQAIIEKYTHEIAELGSEINGETSDGYHTFNELYHHRAVLFSVIVRDHSKRAWKARKHHDGTMYDGMFIVGIETPSGQATYHYDLDPYWDMFDCEEREFAPEWDGHTPDEAIARIATLGRGTREYAIKDNMNETEGMGDVWIECSACHCAFDYYADEWLMNMHYCPKCGARVERGDDDCD